MSKGGKKRQTKKQTLNYREQTDGYQSGGGQGNGLNKVMEIKECTCCDEHWVMYGSVESLYYTPESNITLYVNYTGIKMKT